MKAAIGEAQARTGNDGEDGARDPYYRGRRKAGDPAAELDGAAVGNAADPVAFARVKPEADFELRPVRFRADRAGAADGARRSVEDDEHAAVLHVDGAAAESAGVIGHEALKAL